MKNLLFFNLFIIGLTTNVLGQATVEKRNYWDVWQSQVKRIWHELGDGTWHGDAEFYKQNGILWYRAKMNYGIIENKKWFFQDGSINVEINESKDGKYNGTQSNYYFLNGKRILGDKAIIENDVVKSYESYYQENGNPKFIYTKSGDKESFKRLDKEGNVVIEISLENGKISDLNDYYGLTIKDNRIEKVGINTVTEEIVNGKYYVSMKPQYEPIRYAYYNIPENPSFSFDAKFIYDDAWTVGTGHLDFGLKLDLRGDFNTNDYFTLTLSSLKFDDDNKWTYSANAMAYYFSKLTLDGVYKSYDKIGNAYEINYEDGIEKWKKNYFQNGILKSYTRGDTISEYKENGKLFKETIGKDYKIFDTDGKVIDSKEIRANYNSSLEEYN
ncbi:MAG: hypothetical protein KC414_07960 [Romboutsia sp.]|nr:hypothetical protein [Romboutsia sp.]